MSDCRPQGQLFQYNFSDPEKLVPIERIPTVVTNFWNGVVYVSFENATGLDSLQYQMQHYNTSSAPAALGIEIIVWNQPPHVAAATRVLIKNRKPISIQLPVVDDEQHQYIGVFIKSLPRKGTLYQRLPNGSRGAVITAGRSSDSPTASSIQQYGSKVLNVSSFWGLGTDYSPAKILGPQDAFRRGDSPNSWCPLTADGTGGFAAGVAQGYRFAYNPDLLFENYGYTE